MEEYALLGTISIYSLCIIVISVYVVGQLTLAHFAFKRRHSPAATSDDLLGKPSALPKVTVQLPLYNERNVVERLLNSVVNLEYPADRLEIQILDDSTDETTDVIRRLLPNLREKGILITHLHRRNRKGYKAGALQEGMASAKGEFIAIFDADFIPEPSFLKNLMGRFTDPNIGMVQARWEHLNRHHSPLTQLQAFGLDAHFLVEQVARDHAGFFINFNGTAGIWRKTCIEDAGGWHSDTLTEDLDLSYRAQMNGWVFRFVDSVSVPAELPADMNAYKAQQFRWSKGAIETAKKHFFSIWKSSLPFYLKWQSSIHLTACFTYLCILISGILTVPLVIIKNTVEDFDSVFLFLSVFSPGILCTLLFFYASVTHPKAHRGFTVGQFMKRFLGYLSLSMGMSLHHSVAILRGFFGGQSEFVRTPKTGILTHHSKKMRADYSTVKHPWVMLGELMLGLYFLTGVLISIDFEELSLLPFQALFGFGFLYSFFHTFRDGNVFSLFVSMLRERFNRSLDSVGLLGNTNRNS